MDTIVTLLSALLFRKIHEGFGSFYRRFLKTVRGRWLGTVFWSFCLVVLSAFDGLIQLGNCSAVNVLFFREKINLCHKLVNEFFCDVNGHSNHLLSAGFCIFIIAETL